MKMRGWRQVDRYAVVGGPAWMAALTSWSAPLVRIQTRHFDAAREDEAWQWLEAQPLIPIGADPHALTQSRKPMDMMVQGWSTSLFQASQQWSRMSV